MPCGTRHREIGIGFRPDELETILLDIPDRGIGGNGHLAKRHVSEEIRECALDCITAQDARESSADGRHQAEQPAPVDVDVVLGLQAQSERSDRLRGDTRGEGEPEYGRTGAQRDDGGTHTCLFEGTCGPYDRCHCAASPGRRQSYPLTVPQSCGVGRNRRERLQVPLTRRAGRQAHQCPASIRQEPGIVTQTRHPLAGTRDDVEVLAESKDIEYRTEHPLTMRAQPFQGQGLRSPILVLAE